METYANVQELDVSWHEGSAPGRVLSVVSDDVNQLERFLDAGVDKLWTLALNILLVGAVFAVSSWTLTLLAFLPIPVIVAPARSSVANAGTRSSARTSRRPTRAGSRRRTSL